MQKSICTMIVFVLSAVFISTSAFSEPQYRSEVSVHHQRTDFEFGGRSLDNGVDAALFLAPVKIGDHPYAEADFLEKIGSLNLSAGRDDYRSGTVKADGPYFQAELNYTAPDFPLVIAPSFGISNTDYTNASLKGADTSFYGLAVGKFLSYGLLAAAGYYYTKTSYDYVTAPDRDSKYHQYFVTGKYVKETGGGRGLNLEAVVQRMQYDDGGSSGNMYPFAVNADYYFSRSLSAGVGIMVVNDHNWDGKTYSANLRNFFTPSFYLQVSYDRFLDDQIGQSDSRSFTVTAAARF